LIYFSLTEEEIFFFKDIFDISSSKILSENILIFSENFGIRYTGGGDFSVNCLFRRRLIIRAGEVFLRVIRYYDFDNDNKFFVTVFSFRVED
jgi:hypothetical protein